MSDDEFLNRIDKITEPNAKHAVGRYISTENFMREGHMHTLHAESSAVLEYKKKVHTIRAIFEDWLFTISFSNRLLGNHSNASAKRFQKAAWTGV